MWVVPVQMAAQGSIIAALGDEQDSSLIGNFGQEKHPGSSTIPADVVVRWHDLWRFSDFDKVPQSIWDLGRLYHM